MSDALGAGAGVGATDGVGVGAKVILTPGAGVNRSLGTVSSVCDNQHLAVIFVNFMLLVSGTPLTKIMVLTL